jgi:hypothetical protein
MISVENFYWVLNQHLLEPVHVDCWYYYPWGTTDFLSRNELQLNSDENKNHVLFHFDQEPLFSNNLGKLYDEIKDAWKNYKVVKILANSEHSSLKKQICKERSMLNWYFFYHGFAALDWFRDAKYMQQEYPIKNAFLSFNHMFKNRWYRLAMLARLLDKKITHKGSISFHTTQAEILAGLCDSNTQLSLTSRNLIQNNIHNLSDLPWQLDAVPINGDLSARFGRHELQLWQSSLWHIVNETVFYEPKLHLTEKVFKPIVAKRPFVLAAAPGNLAYLRSYGFQTFDHWIDESYDHIQDPDQRLDAIANEIARFAHMSLDELRHIRHDMMSVLEHNKQHFFGQFREIIVNELVDNFDQCIRIWNNGRVDGRELTMHPDLESVKQILLR